MNDSTGWKESNAQYLSKALVWLHARLERLAAQPPGSLAPSAPPAPDARQESAKSLWQHIVGRPPRKPDSTLPSLLPAPVQKGQEGVEDAAAALMTVGSLEHSPALSLLAQRLGLSEFEQHVLLLCGAIELDPSIATLCARAQSDPNRPFPTFALALSMFNGPAWDVLSPERPLRYWRLIEINQPPGQPLTVSPLRADERIINYLKGLNYLDDRLGPLVTPLDPQDDGAELPPSQQRTVENIVGHLKQASSHLNPALIQLLGTDTGSKHLIATTAARALGLRVFHLPAGLIPAQASELETLARLWQRESLLLPVALYVDVQGSEMDGLQAGQNSPVSRFLARLGGVVFLDNREVWPGLEAESLQADVAKPTSAEQESAWNAALGETAGEIPALLAGHFDLNIPSIQRTVRKAQAGPTSEPKPLKDRLWEACLASTRPRLDTLAMCLDPKARWDDIVLPAAESNLLHEIAAQVKQRTTVYQSWGFGDRMSHGLGISALFAGEPGTGKTMAAEVIANALHLSLYRIDLSAVVSKYIGETEKNLRRLFDAAEMGGTILFFDEADALFGKRSEVKDSHDRYANIEVNYLLQRMEAYRGLAILATNMRSALDPAFMRRLRFVVNFPFPAVPERKLIWQKVFPGRTPTAELNFDFLSRLNLTGGNIHSIALSAAFLAAEAGVNVTMPLLINAARAELRKLGRVINELEFRGAAGAARVA